MDEELHILAGRDEPVLDLLSPQPAPVGPLEAVAVGGLRKAALHQVPSAAVIVAGLRALRLGASAQHLIMPAVALDDAAVPGVRAAMPQRASLADPFAGLVFGVLPARIVAARIKPLPGRAAVTVGGLVVVNDLVEVLSPEVLAFKIAELFRKRNPAGQLQFPEIEGVWILSETHLVEVSHGVKAIPGVVLVRDDRSAAARIIDELPREWAQAHGMPFLEMNPELGGTVKFESATAPEEKKDPLKRYELWDQQYRQQPYLRRHTDDELKHYFNLVMKGVAPGMLKGATAADRELSHLVMERWTHLLHELNERGIDMRLFSPGMQEMGAKFKAGEWPRTTLAEIEAAGRIPVTMEPGRYYTNSLGKSYRCLRVQSESATLLLLNQLMGKTLDIVMGVSRPNWHYYWPLLDSSLTAALDKRFERFRARHPKLDSKP